MSKSQQKRESRWIRVWKADGQIHPSKYVNDQTPIVGAFENDSARAKVRIPVGQAVIAIALALGLVSPGCKPGDPKFPTQGYSTKAVIDCTVAHAGEGVAEIAACITADTLSTTGYALIYYIRDLIRARLSAPGGRAADLSEDPKVVEVAEAIAAELESSR